MYFNILSTGGPALFILAYCHFRGGTVQKKQSIVSQIFGVLDWSKKLILKGAIHRLGLKISL